MREKVGAWQRRTGREYDPPEALRALARPLATVEACPTLFRDPGPAGIRERLAGRGGTLAPRGERWVWLSDRPLGGGTRGARSFGVLAVLAPLQLLPCRVTGRAGARGHYLAANAQVPAGLVAWVPPSLLRAPIPWDGIRDALAARRAMGPAAGRERREVARDLGRYFEEIGRLRAAGAPDPGRPWCEVPAAERRGVLAALGIAAVWSGPRRP